MNVKIHEHEVPSDLSKICKSAYFRYKAVLDKSKQEKVLFIKNWKIKLNMDALLDMKR